MGNFTLSSYNQDIIEVEPCIGALKLTIGPVIGLLASGYSSSQILKMYPYLKEEDIMEALSFAAWQMDDFYAPLGMA